MKTILITALLATSMALPAFCQTAEAYDVEDAYQIYSVLLPQEEAYGLATGTLVIQEETTSKPELAKPCMTPKAASQFKDAIDDYNHLNRKQWLLQRRFKVDKPYEIVSSDAIRVVFNEENWDSFYKRYPDSGGYIVMSAVGFNKEKSRAIVFMGTSCGSLCGRWGFHLFEKIHGNWKAVPGVTCITFS